MWTKCGQFESSGKKARGIKSRQKSDNSTLNDILGKDVANEKSIWEQNNGNSEWKRRVIETYKWVQSYKWKSWTRKNGFSE